jgi:lysozyme family protein
MVRVALLQQDVRTPTGDNSAFAQPVQLPTGTTQLAAQLTQTVQAVGSAYEQSRVAQERQQKLDAAAWSANAASNATLTWQQKMQDAQLNSAAGAPDFTKSMLSDFDQWKTDQLAAAPNTDSKHYLDQHLTALRNTIGSQSIAFEGQQKVKWRTDQIDNAFDAAANAAFNDPSQASNLIATATAPVDAIGLPGAVRDELVKRGTQKVQLAAAMSVARSNPAAIVGAPGSGSTSSSPGQAPGGFQSADAFVADKEGGFVANDNGRGPTNFGINQQANPDIDVANLTPEQASATRKTRYWDAIHADALPPALQPVAYNFAIQAGAGAANRLLAESNGDPAKFNDLAKQYYASIPQDKANGNTAAWQARSDEALALGKSAAAASDNSLLAGLNFQTRIQVFNEAKTQQNQNMAYARARIEGRLQDVQAMAAQGVSDPTPLSLNTLLQAYPPDEAAQRYAQYRDGQQLATDVSSIKGMPSDQINSLVQSRAPLAGPGYAQAQHDQAILAQAAGHVLEQRNADPATYVVNNAAGVQSLQKAFAANPTPQTAQAYAQASIAEQQRLGIPKPQILSKGQATSIEDQIKANNGANADQVIQQQAQLWGPQWGNVFGQLKDIPPVAKVVGYLGDSIDASTRQQIMQASQVKIDDLKDGLVPANVTAASQALQAKTAPFAATMAYTVGGAQTFGALYDSAERLTYTYMRQGQSPADAASNAFSAVMGKNFNVVDSARIPSQYDADQVMRGARDIQSNLPNLDLMTPPAPANMKPADVKQQYASNLKANGKWITAADGKGLVLFDPVSQTVVRTKDGNTVGAPFSQLTTKLGTAPTNTTPNPFLPADVGAPVGVM